RTQYSYHSPRDNQVHGKLLSKVRLNSCKAFQTFRALRGSQSQNRNRKEILFRECAHRDKILACDNITTCCDSCSITVDHATIAPAQEHYQFSGPRRGLICALTDQDSRCSRRKSCTSNPSFMSYFGFCAAIPTSVT